jgi:hypothetical protein
MKFRSGVRITAADRGSRAGNARPAGLARPGTADPAARAGHPRFSAGHHGAYHKRQGRFPNRRVITRRTRARRRDILRGHRPVRRSTWRTAGPSRRLRRPHRPTPCQRHRPRRLTPTASPQQTGNCAHIRMRPRSTVPDIMTRISSTAQVSCVCEDSPLCRHHHKCKQAEGWQLAQPEPGVLVWRTPAGRTYATGPTAYLT